MARIKHAGCRCHTYTNGILLNTDMIDELIKMKFDEIRFSVMAGTDEMYLRTHPGVKDNTFYNLKQNLLYLAQRKSELCIKYPEVTLVYIVIGENYNGLFEFAEFADLVKADRVFFNPFDDVGDPGLMKLAPTKEQSDYIKKEIVRVKDYLEARKIKHNIINFLNVFREQLNTTELYKLIPCYYGWLAALIDPDGVVNPCCRCYRSPGNIYEHSFKDIWYSPSYNQFRKISSMINVTHKFPEACDCNSCVNHTANLRVYKLLNPFKGNSRQIKLLSSNLPHVD
jgi:MoaA/NifB/PqqE/SkfB family radical SAM enzyme